MFKNFFLHSNKFTELLNMHEINHLHSKRSTEFDKIF